MRIFETSSPLILLKISAQQEDPPTPRGHRELSQFYFEQATFLSQFTNELNFVSYFELQCKEIN